MTKLTRLAYLYAMRSFGFFYADEPRKNQEKSYLDLDYGALAAAVKDCSLCALSKTRKNTVFCSGDPSADLMVIGEAPGEQEDLTGLPFVGDAGKLLDKMLENAAGIPRSRVYVANILKCRPPGNRRPQEDEAALCIGYLLRQIELVRPKVIFCLGSTALHYLLKTDVSISRARGKIYSFKNTPTLVSFHPSYLLRNPSAKGLAYADCLLLRDLMKKNGILLA
ncbi:MAG: uracil-DNA glycosylase [Helicobacteraceae bacterium]